jgi:hypothetical protein
MKHFKAVLELSCALCSLAVALPALQAQDTKAQAPAQVHMVITQESVVNGDSVTLQKQDVTVKQGKTVLKVDALIPAKGDSAALQLFILIDDTLYPGVGNNLNDIRDFIKAQPKSTMVGVGYMRNATVQDLQNFTDDHELAAKAVRLPFGRLSSMDSPYLSLNTLIKSWPQQKVRRVVLMVTDGVDRLHGFNVTPSILGGGTAPVYHSMPSMSPDVNSVSELAQKLNVLVYSIYSPSVGRASRSFLDQEIGLSSLNKIADETGGDFYSLGTSSLVSFKPYLDRFQNALDNQYYLVFQPVPKSRQGLQRISITTNVSNAEVAAPDNAWVPAAAKK